MRMSGVRFPSLLFLVVVLAVMGLFLGELLGQTAPATVRADRAEVQGGKVRLGIGAVKVLPSLQVALDRSDQGTAVRRFAETIEGQLLNALQNTQKFELVARNDLDEFLREQSRTGIDPDDNKAALSNRVKGLEYLALITLDDFVDSDETIFAQDMNMVVSRRTLRTSAVVRIYDATTGVLAQSVALPVQVQTTGTSRAVVGQSSSNPRATDDSIYVTMANQLANQVGATVTDTIFPAKVLAVTGGYVTLNRGAGTIINPGEMWEVFAPGAELKDPDTGESLGREEMKVGEIVISDVLPKFSKGQIVGDNRGVAVGNIVRPKRQIPAQAPAQVADPVR